LDARLTILLCRKIVVKSKEVKTGWLSGRIFQGYGSKKGWFVDDDDVHLEAFTVVTVKITAFLAVTPGRLVGGYSSFGGTCRLHVNSEDGGSVFLRNICIRVQEFTLSQHKRSQF
jgi:hypothetical protein